MGPVTLCMIRFENDTFSMRDPAPHRILMGQPYVSWMTQLEMVMSSASPPPKRNIDQRVLNVQLVTVTKRLLPNSAQASSWQVTLQLAMFTYWFETR